MRHTTSLVSLLVVVILVVAGIQVGPAAGADNSTVSDIASADELPLWAEQKPLWELAQGSTEQRPIPPDDPQPIGSCWKGKAVRMGNGELKVALWGPPEQLTWSVSKTDVWDRRHFPEKPITLEQIRERCFDESYNENRFDNRNKYYVSNNAYEFPCPKPVGQLILMCPDLAGAEQPTTTKQHSDSLVTVPLKSAQASATLQSVVMMTRNIIIAHGQFTGLTQPLQVRLYRHRDTMRPGKSSWWGAAGQLESKPDYDYSKDSPTNDPLDPPQAGSDGRLFWIRQDFPGEATFPQGFWYVFMGLVVGEDYEVEVVEGETGLGTPPYFSVTARGGKEGETRESLPHHLIIPWYELIREAPGVATTATIDNPTLTILATVVTSAEADDPIAAAKEELQKAERDGYEALLAENRGWFQAHCNRREDGRIYYRQPGSNMVEARDALSSWYYQDTARTRPNIWEWEGDSGYAHMEQDWSPWHADNHLNEDDCTSYCVHNRIDRVQMWYDIGEFILPRARINAREVYGCNGAMCGLSHVPVRTRTIYHSNVVWEQGMELWAQLAKMFWQRYDYAGDEEFLRDKAYPILKAGAEFYADYVTLEEDGYYHVIPTVSQEHWGLTYKFERNQDSISALCMIKWNLNTAARAAQILGRDADKIDTWRHIAANMAPYPTYQTEEGPIFVDVRGAPPIAYNIVPVVYPAVLADEITLDSAPGELEIMKRTIQHALQGESRWHLGTAEVEIMGKRTGTGPENLLNCRSGRIRLFPTVPKRVDVGFRKFLAKGAFEVSAEYVDGEVSPVFIHSRLGNRCRLVNPWPGREVLIREIEVAEPLRIRGSHLQFRTRRGATYKIEPATP